MRVGAVAYMSAMAMWTCGCGGGATAGSSGGMVAGDPKMVCEAVAATGAPNSQVGDRIEEFLVACITGGPSSRYEEALAVFELACRSVGAPPEELLQESGARRLFEMLGSESEEDQLVSVAGLWVRLQQRLAGPVDLARDLQATDYDSFPTPIEVRSLVDRIRVEEGGRAASICCALVIGVRFYSDAELLRGALEGLPKCSGRVREALLEQTSAARIGELVSKWMGVGPDDARCAWALRVGGVLKYRELVPVVSARLVELARCGLGAGAADYFMRVGGEEAEGKLSSRATDLGGSAIGHVLRQLGREQLPMSALAEITLVKAVPLDREWSWRIIGEFLDGRRGVDDSKDLADVARALRQRCEEIPEGTRGRIVKALDEFIQVVEAGSR